MALPFIDLWLCEQRRGYIRTNGGLRSLNDDEEELFQPKLLWTVLACASAVSMAISGYAYGVLNSLPWCSWSPWTSTTRRREQTGNNAPPQFGQQPRRRRRSSAPAASPYVAGDENKWNSTGETSPQYHHVRHQIFLTIMAWIACIALLTAAVIVVIQLTTYFRFQPTRRDRVKFLRNSDDTLNTEDERITQSLIFLNPSVLQTVPDWRSFANSLHDLAVARLLAVKIALVIADFCFLSYLFWRICHAISIYLLFKQKKLPFIVYVVFAVALPIILKTLDVTLLFNSYFAYHRQSTSPVCSTTPAQTLIRSIAYAVVLLLVALVEHVLHLRTLRSIRQMFVTVNTLGGENSEEEPFGAEDLSSSGGLQQQQTTAALEYEKECLNGIRNKLRVIRICFLVCWAPLAVLNIMAAVVYYLYYYSTKANVVDDETDRPLWWGVLLQFMVGLSYFCAVVRPFQLLFDAFAYWDSAVPPPPKTILQYNNTNYDTCTVYSSSDAAATTSFLRTSYQPPPPTSQRHETRHQVVNANEHLTDEDSQFMLLDNSLRSSANLYDEVLCAPSTPEPTAPITRAFKYPKNDRCVNMKYYYARRSESEATPPTPTELPTSAGGKRTHYSTAVPAHAGSTHGQTSQSAPSASNNEDVTVMETTEQQSLLAEETLTPLQKRRQRLRETFAQRLVTTQREDANA